MALGTEIRKVFFLWISEQDFCAPIVSESAFLVPGRTQEPAFHIALKSVATAGS
jgi:hypothetical protein